MLYLDSTLVGEAYARLRAAGGDTDVLVLGVGDAQMGDEGAGIHVVRHLVREPPIPGVRLLDGGIAGAHLLPELDGVRALLIVTAVRDRQPAGAVTYSQPQRADDLPCEPTPSREGLAEFFSAALLLGRLPATHLYSISISGPCLRGSPLSVRIAEAVVVASCTMHGHAARLASPGHGVLP
jgi:hydrogenase maturation protease